MLKVGSEELQTMDDFHQEQTQLRQTEIEKHEWRKEPCAICKERFSLNGTRKLAAEWQRVAEAESAYADATH